MEEEEKAAQSAKLQELIRRGGPEDLQEANRLMKIMAGYDTKNKTDYRAKAAEEVGKIQQKARILEERLQNFSSGDKVEEGDVFEVRVWYHGVGGRLMVCIQELANALQSAQPKIQKMCEEESDDQEAVAKLLEINDSIHRTIERYKLIKKGDLDAASKIPKGTLGTSTGVSRTADNELSLIDLGGDPESSTAGGDLLQASGPVKAESFEDDLLGLSMQDQSYGQGGGIALGFGANTSEYPGLESVFDSKANAPTVQDIPGPSLLSSTMQQSTAKYPTPIPTPHPQPQQLPGTSKPNYDAFAGLSSPRPVSQSVVPPPFMNQQPTAIRPPQTLSDPFASLSKPTSRTASPFPNQQTPQQAVASPATSMFNLAQHAPQAPAQQTNGTSTDDDWNFSSALPDDGSSLPATNHLIVSNTSVNISFAVSRPSDRDSVINVLAKFSNTTFSPITEYTFQVAVTKVKSTLPSL